MTPVANETLCPLCAEPNHCRLANGCLYKGACWCEQADVPAHLLRFMAESQLEPACLCRRCLALLAHHARNLEYPAQVLTRVREDIGSSASSADSYRDQQDRVVFTADFHLKRGYCCDNGCRHCPYRPSSN
jgi:hypothetical protein